MAIDVTDVYCRHPEDHDLAMKVLMDQSLPALTVAKKVKGFQRGVEQLLLKRPAGALPAYRQLRAPLCCFIMQRGKGSVGINPQAGEETGEYAERFISTDRRKMIARFASLDYPATERRFNCYYAEFFPVAPEKLRPHDHAGVEFLYVIDGGLTVHLNGQEHALQAGDAMYFDSTIPHAYRRSGGRKCSAVVVTAA